MNKIFSLLLIVFLSGCATLGMPEHKQDKLINVLINKKEKAIFLVGDKYTYIYEKKKNMVLYELNKYEAMKKLIEFLQNAEEVTFQKNPEIRLSRTVLLNGSNQYNKSGIEISAKVKPSKKQLEYLNTLKPNYRSKNRAYFILDHYTPRHLQLSYKKTKCFLGKCSDKHEEYIIFYKTRSNEVKTVKTTTEMKKLKNRMNKNIPIDLIISEYKEKTKEEYMRLEKERKKYKNDLYKRKNITNKIIGVAVFIPIMVAASPFLLFTKLTGK